MPLSVWRVWWLFILPTLIRRESFIELYRVASSPTSNCHPSVHTGGLHHGGKQNSATLVPAVPMLPGRDSRRHSRRRHGRLRFFYGVYRSVRGHHHCLWAASSIPYLLKEKYSKDFSLGFDDFLGKSRTPVSAFTAIDPLWPGRSGKHQRIISRRNHSGPVDDRHTRPVQHVDERQAQNQDEFLSISRKRVPLYGKPHGRYPCPLSSSFGYLLRHIYGDRSGGGHRGLCPLHRIPGFIKIFILIRDLPKLMINSMVLVGTILIILGTAMGFTSYLVMSKFPCRFWIL